MVEDKTEKISVDELLPEIEHRHIHAFIKNHRCKARVVRGEMTVPLGCSNHFELGIYIINGHAVSRTISCKECGYWEGTHLLKDYSGTAEGGIFSISELEKMVSYINKYSPAGVRESLGMETLSLDKSSATYHITLLGLHVGVWQKTISIPTELDITDYC